MTSKSEMKRLNVMAGREINDGLDMKNGETFEAESEYLYQRKIEELEAEVERMGELASEWQNNFVVACEQRDKLEAEVGRLDAKNLAIEHEAGHKIFDLTTQRDELKAEVERLKMLEEAWLKANDILFNQRDKLASGLREIALTIDGFEANNLARQTLKDAGLET